LFGEGAKRVEHREPDRVRIERCLPWLDKK
jgi:hypothetical protein